MSHETEHERDQWEGNDHCPGATKSKRPECRQTLWLLVTLFLLGVVGSPIYVRTKRETLCDSNTQNERGLRNDKNDPINIVYSSDERSLEGVRASIRSIRAHASKDVIIHFVGDAPLESMPYVNFVDIAKVDDKYNLHDFINTHSRHKSERDAVNLNRNLPNYVRFVMDELLPDVEKAMWIDADTIVKCDVVEMARKVLVDHNNSENVIAAIPVEGKPNGLYRHDRHGNLIPDWGISVSFNAGIYFVDLDRWRAHNMTGKIRDLTLRNREFRYYRMGSQPPLALTIGENFEHLPLTWNVKMETIDERDDGVSLENACVLHWSGAHKPWDGSGEHLEEWAPYNVDIDADTERDLS